MNPSNNRTCTCQPGFSRPGMNVRPMPDYDQGSSCSIFDTMPQRNLWNQINEISFVVDDMVLYLDTHPYDEEAKQYMRLMVQKRVAALNVYAKRFGPLNLDVTDKTNGSGWEWILQPWPWEIIEKGGRC